MTSRRSRGEDDGLRAEVDAFVVIDRGEHIVRSVTMIRCRPSRKGCRPVTCIALHPRTDDISTLLSSIFLS